MLVFFYGVSMEFSLDFEKPVKELENQIKELKEASVKQNIDITEEVKALQAKVDKMVKEVYGKLTPWDRVQLSRHPQRPHSVDYIKLLVEDFHEVHGDRRFGDDRAMICGFGHLNDGKTKQKVCVVGIEKGRKTKEKITHNFGMPQPEGYRKAIRVMKMASNFGIPIVTFVDTPGAYPGLEAEERGQAQAIAESLQEMFSLSTPVVSVVIGEGGSGGALGIAIANKLLMMEYSIYSVISPESCASILWSDPKMAEKAANALKLDPHKAMELEVADDVVSEPAGGAHRDWDKAAGEIRKHLFKNIKELSKLSEEKLIEQRYVKFRRMGNISLNSSDKENLKIFK